MPVPTAGIYRLGATVAIEAAPMGDDTKELLNAHHAAILRELDGLGRDLRSDLSDLKSDNTITRARLESHAHDDNQRFGTIDRSMAVLKWAYALGIFVIVALLTKMGLVP